MNAFLIMCHKNPVQVVRLAKKCSTENSKVFIHIDKKMDSSDEDVLHQLIANTKNIVICKEKISGVLDTKSLVDITMLLVDEVKSYEIANKVHFDYYLLLSGQDYLIKPIRFIEDMLKKSYPQPFIDCTPYAFKNWIWYKFQGTFSNDIISTKISMMRRSNFRKALRLVQFLWKKISLKIEGSTYDYLDKKNIKLFGGSAWWILPDDIIDHIHTKYKKKDKIVKRLLFSYTPEETFFQTVLMNSKFKDRVEINEPYENGQNCKTWAYFSDKDKEFRGHPYIFTINEIEKLKSNKCWIARKFDIDVDEKVLDMIDNEIG